jgi:membrane protein YdbS with pleckstrin-like domain
MTTNELLPDRRLMWKWAIQILVLFLIAGLPMIILGGLIGRDEGGAAGMRLGLMIPFLGSLAWVILLFVLIRPYFNSLCYHILDDEVVMEVGVITRSVKHVPYRTVTNLKMARGPFDRLFGLGTLNIQTAGMSGQSGAEESLIGLEDVESAYSGQSGAEESLIGLEDVESAYSLVAASLRRYRRAMPPTGAGEEEMDEGEALATILEEVKRIRKSVEGRS